MGCHQPRESCRSWWSTAVSRLHDTTACCKHHCLRCWGSGQTLLQKSAGTAGPGCTWCQAALLVTAGYFLVHPAGSPLWLQYKATLYEADYIVVYGDYTLWHCDNCKCVTLCVWHDTSGKIFRASCILTIKMNNLGVTNAVQFYG